MLKLILEKLKRCRRVCNPQVLVGLMGIALLCVLPLHTGSHFSSFLSKSQPISHLQPLEYQDLMPYKLSGTRKRKLSSPQSFHSGSADGRSLALANDTCICCKLMNINAGGLSIIFVAEGFVATPYRCPAGVISQGFGSTILLDGTRVKMDSPPITEDEGKALLRRHLDHVETGILKFVRVPLNENEFSALCSWTYNLGIGRLQSSTLRAKLNRGERLGAANEFPKWVRAGGRVLRGLVIRREAERQLFLTPISHDPSFKNASF